MHGLTVQLIEKPLPKPDLRSMFDLLDLLPYFVQAISLGFFGSKGGDSASAWAAGCPVIVKAHHAHPGTALLIAEKVVECMQQCNWPEGAFFFAFWRRQNDRSGFGLSSCYQSSRLYRIPVWG